jgi:hypothetical protein
MEGRPSTVTLQPRPVGQSGAWSSPNRVMCSTVSAGRPPTIAVSPNRWAETVPASMRPAFTSKALAANATRRSYTRSSMVASNPSASSISGARKTGLAIAASAIGTGSSGGLPKPMTSKSMAALS